MKKLLNKTLRTFTVYALIVLAASISAYYFLVNGIWFEELDEHNRILATHAEAELNRLKLPDNDMDQVIQLWNKIQPGTNLVPAGSSRRVKDSVYTARRRNVYITDRVKTDQFRGLVRMIQIDKKPYLLTVETNVEESEDTVAAIALVTSVFFLILVIGFLILNRRLSGKLWKPFRSTLSRLKAFNLNSQEPVSFEKSDTVEFEELNEVLTRLIRQNIDIYKTQKEFTENASHELQTPLAIIKNKLDLLLQEKTLTDRQYEIIENIHRTLTRISRINKNLLLLAKIENHQFDDTEEIHLSELAGQCFQQAEEYGAHKDLFLRAGIAPGVFVKGNNTLTELLINNLLLNAIRYTEEGGTLAVTLTADGLIVCNSGTAPIDQTMLFERFAKNTNENTGSGLGLSIVKEICRYHHWKITYAFEQKQHRFIVSF